MRRSTWPRLRVVGVLIALLGTFTTATTAAAWWWTDLQSRARAHRLADQATSSWEGTVAPSNSDPSPAQVADIRGQVIAVVQVPRFAADWRMPVQRGTGTRVLREGLGLYPTGPQLGGPGNVSIAGHRTTWGAPFKHLDEMRPGDAIFVRTAGRRFEYRVTSRGVTDPGDTSVIRPELEGTRAMLTLTTCHPEFSSGKRLYVHARLIAGTSSEVPAGISRPRPGAAPDRSGTPWRSRS
jgi:sortase A